MHKGSKVDLPPELFHYRSTVEQYVEARIREFAVPFGYKLNPNVSIDQLLQLASDTLAMLKLSQMPQAPSHNLRLVLKHDCESSGCGDGDCELCKFNPNRLCKRNLKQKYLIDDNLKAKCNANVRVEINDEQGRIHALDLILEVNVLSWDKYKEVSSQSQLLSVSQLRSCFVQNAQKSLLRREGNKDHEEQRVVLQLERGSANLSELQVTTSSEALLSGKAPGFMLLIWAVDVRGEPLSGIQYVVSEKFVVTTKRVKQAIKSDIPSVDQHVSKLVHVGRATVDKLNDLRQAAHEEQIDIDLPDDLYSVEKVGQFQRLVEMAEVSSDFKQKLLKLLKLSPEKWEELSQHALAAVHPDFRPRYWRTEHNVGLLFMCKHGAAVLDHPVALIQLNADMNVEDKVVPIQQLEPNLRDLVTQLRRQAKAAWYQPSHPQWGIYWKNSDTVQQLIQGANQPETLSDVGDLGTCTRTTAGNAPSPASQTNMSPPTTPQLSNMGSGMPLSNMAASAHSPPNPTSPMNKSNPSSPIGLANQLPNIFHNDNSPPLYPDAAPSGLGINPSQMGMAHNQLNPGMGVNRAQMGLPPSQMATALNMSQLNTNQMQVSSPNLGHAYPPGSPISPSNPNKTSHAQSAAAAAAAAGRPPPAKRQQPSSPSPFTQDSLALGLGQAQHMHPQWDMNGGRPNHPPGPNRASNTPSPFASNILQHEMFTSIAPGSAGGRFTPAAPVRNPESIALQLASGVTSFKMPSDGASMPPPQLPEGAMSLEMLDTDTIKMITGDTGMGAWNIGSSAAIPNLSTILNTSGLVNSLHVPSNNFDAQVARLQQANEQMYGSMVNPALQADNLSLKLSMSLDLVGDNQQDGQAKAY